MAAPERRVGCAHHNAWSLMVGRAHPTRWSLLAAALLAAATTSARADLFLLENGGRVEGEWLNREELPRRVYLVKTAAGVTLSLPEADVREAIRQSPAVAEYAKRAPATPDTLDAQWALAEWCRVNRLTHERETHLERIIRLDPNHQDARRALGYQFLQGKWVSRDQHFRELGMEFYRGKWRTPQSIEILESRGRKEVAEKDWAVKLRRWRRDLADPDKARQAYELIAAIDDPHAVPALASGFRQERDRRVRMLYADVLANIKTSPAVQILVHATLDDGDEEIYYYCLDKLAQLQLPHVGDPYVAALKDASNPRVNRAASALAHLQDRSAISPLIDALITTHQQVQPGTMGPNATSTTFGSGGTVMKQNEGPRILIVQVQNQQVLDALTRLTGVNFSFDQRAWRYWHAQEKIAAEAQQPPLDARRD
ncbi:MAG TPA: HEAT repeat domain-containing protein [Pirellulaceae bacterium]|nr:HEAT repeat domain-containing protein [Pirellulaceae bacterium]